MLDLTKKIEKGTYRWLGENYDSLFPNKTVIAGNSIIAILSALNYSGFKFGRYDTKNVVIAHNDKDIFYLFVNPHYKLYRKVFKKLIGDIPTGFHVDHILSKNLAKHFGYNYVLLCLIPNIVNIRHGAFEKERLEYTVTPPEVCYSDDRIYHKVLSRNPTARQKREEITPYQPQKNNSYGLTLKQRGVWNSAFGFDKIDKPSLMKVLSPIT